MNPLFGSKKATFAVLASLLTAVGVERGWSPEQIGLVLMPLTLGLGVQGVIDHKATVPGSRTPASAEPGETPTDAA